MGDEIERLLKEYLKVRHRNPCLANSYLEDVIERLREVPFKEVEYIRDFVMSNAKRFPFEFVEEVNFEYVRRRAERKISILEKFI